MGQNIAGGVEVASLHKRGVRENYFWSQLVRKRPLIYLDFYTKEMMLIYKVSRTGLEQFRGLNKNIKLQNST